MLLRVQYPNSKYDYVDAMALDKFIVSKGIKKFLRPVENVWVDIEQEPIRGQETVDMDAIGGTNIYAYHIQTRRPFVSIRTSKSR